MEVQIIVILLSLGNILIVTMKFIAATNYIYVQYLIHLEIYQPSIIKIWYDINPLQKNYGNGLVVGSLQKPGYIRVR